MIQSSRRIILVVCVALLAIAGVFNLSTVASAQDVPDATVTTPVLRIRERPASTGKVVGTAARGMGFKIDGRDTYGIWLHGTAANGVTGWASRYFLKLRAGLKIAALPLFGTSAPAAGNNAPTPPPAANDTNNTNNAPVVVSGSTGGGFEVGGQVQGLDGATIDAMHRAHMHWVKFQVGVGDNTGYNYIDSAHASGFKVLLSVKGDKGSVLNPGYFNQYAGYVGALAGHGVDAVEVWNEANLDREWPNGKINPATYTQLLAAAYNAIKSNNRNTIVISGAPSPTGAGVTDAYWNDDVYYAGMAAAGAGRYADCIGVHYNEGIVSPNQNTGGWLAYPTNYFSPMLTRALAKFPGKKACFTELGYLTSEGYGGLPGGFAWAKNVTVAQQAAWLAQAAVKASASGRVRLMIVWNVNMTYYGEDPQAGFAIIRPGGACPACDTLAQVVR